MNEKFFSKIRDMTEEAQRYYKLERMLNLVGSEVLRIILQSHVSPNDVLDSVEKESFLRQKFKSWRMKKIKESKEKGDYRQMDIPLLYKLLRYLADVKPPTKNWGTSIMPSPDEITTGDDIERIRILNHIIIQNRNTCTLTEIDFEKYFAILYDVTSRHCYGHSIRSIPLRRILDNIKEMNIYSRQESKSLRGKSIYMSLYTAM